MVCSVYEGSERSEQEYKEVLSQVELSIVENVVCFINGASKRSVQEDKEVVTGELATQIRRITIRDDVRLDKA